MSTTSFVGLASGLKPQAFNGVTNPAFTVSDTVFIQPPPPPTGVLIPDTVVVAVGDSIRIQLDTVGAAGQQIPIPPSAISFLNNTPSVDSVSANGEVYGLAVGSGSAILLFVPPSGLDNELIDGVPIVVVPAGQASQVIGARIMRRKHRGP